MQNAKASRPGTLATFLAIQAVLVCWWLAYHPGLFSRDSVLYLSHTMAGPWVSDHSVVYDALLWLSVRVSGDLGLVTLLQTTAMAATLTYLATALRALGAPPRSTTAVAVLMPFLPPVGAFAVTLWKDVPFTLCVVAIAASCAGMAAARTVTVGRLAGLGVLMTALGLFRANGFLIVAVAVVVLVLVVKVMRVRLALVGTVAAAVPLLLTNLVFRWSASPPRRRRTCTTRPSATSRCSTAGIRSCSATGTGPSWRPWHRCRAGRRAAPATPSTR